MKNEKEKNLSRKLVTNPTDYMSSFKQNIRMYMEDRDITLKDVSNISNINIETLKSFLYGNNKDCKLSTAISLAKMFNVSVDEIVGCDTINSKLLDIIKIVRSMPDDFVYQAHWMINYQDKRLSEDKNINNKYVNVITPDVDGDGNVIISNNIKVIDITSVEEHVRQKAFFGIKIVHDRYMPMFSPYNVLLIANDRRPLKNDKCVIIKNKYMWLAYVRDGKYYSVKDGSYRGDIENDSELIGYVCGAVKDFSDT